MISTLFYRPERRIEDMLTHWFLAFLDRLAEHQSPACRDLFEELGFKLGDNWKKDFRVESQVNIGEGRRIDGLITGQKYVIGFENKIDDKHKMSQIREYYKLLHEKHEQDCALLLTFDWNTQTRNEVEKLIRAGEVPEKDVRLATWQDVHQILIDIAEKSRGTGFASFLCREMARVLEKMKMKSYTGINKEQIKSYFDVKQNLSVLDQLIRESVKAKFDWLLEGSGSDGSLTRKRITFPFRKGEKSTFLFFRLGEDSLHIGVRCPRRSTDLERLKERLDYRSLLNILEKSKEYEVYGFAPALDKSHGYEEIRQLDGKPKLHDRLQVSKEVRLEEMSRKDFKDHIKDEIDSLEGLVVFLHQTLVE